MRGPGRRSLRLIKELDCPGGPEVLGNTVRKRFADQLERFLARPGKG